MKLPVFKTIGATFAFLRGNFAACVRITWLPVAIASGVSHWFARKAEALEVQIHALNRKTDAAEILQIELQALGWIALLTGVMFALYPVAYAGLLRWIVRGEKPRGFFYLRFGGDELRLVGVWFAVFALFVLMSVGVVAAAGGLAYFAGYPSSAVRTSLELPAVGIALVLVVLLAALSVWVLLRLSLVSATAIAAKSMGIVRSWKQSRGNSLRLLALWFFVGVLPFALYYIAYFALLPDYLVASLATFRGERDPAAVGEAMRAMDREAAAMLPLLSGLTFAFNLVYVPLTAIAAGFAYNVLAGRSDMAANESGEIA